MCGLIGATGPGRREVVEAGLRLILHRGPDGNGLVETAGATLGHCRLAIIDPAHGAQPWVSDDGRHVLVYNGEIYNFRELRHQLRQTGHQFRTDGDTEVLMAWLATYGVEGLAALSGMFAFALWDRRERRVLLARDRLGIKPLYWTPCGGRDIAFASEIKGLLPARKRVEPNGRAIFQYLTFQQVMTDESFFAGIHRLEPGGWLEWRDGQTRQGYFWTAVPQAEADQRAAAARYSEVLDGAIRRHLIADVPVGCYLSSGIDSSSVATLSTRLAGRPLTGFVGAFTEAPYYDERPGARLVAKAGGVALEEIVIRPEDFTTHLADVCWHLDEPTLGSGALPQYMLAAHASRSVRVVLTGHGGDELFAGYQVNKAVRLRQLLRRPWQLPAFLASVRRDELTRILYFLMFPLISPDVGCGMHVMIPRRQRSRLLSGDFLHSLNDYDPLAEAARVTAGLSPADGLLMLYLRTYLQTLLIQEDKVGMAHGLEARMPLCDNQLLELSLGLDLDTKLTGGELKAIPRAAMRPHLPPELFRLPKRGFPTPLAHWFRGDGPARQLVGDLLASPRARQRGIMLPEAMEALLALNDRSAGDGLADYARATRLYSLAMLELWFRQFADGEGLARHAGNTAPITVTRLGEEA